MNTVHQTIQKFRLKLYYAKKEAIYEHDPEILPFSLGQFSLKMDWAKVENVFCVRTNYSLKFTLKTWKLHHLD